VVRPGLEGSISLLGRTGSIHTTFFMIRNRPWPCAVVRCYEQPMPMTVKQCRAGRALLGWSIGELAAAADVGVMTVNRFEGGQPIRPASIDKLEAALTAAGISLIAAGERPPEGGEGVRISLTPRQ